MKKTYSTPLVTASDVARETAIQAGKPSGRELFPVSSLVGAAFGL